MVGVVPTAAEAKKFLQDNSPEKRVKLVDELLARKEDYAAHWTPFWEEAIGSANVDKVGGIASRGSDALASALRVLFWVGAVPLAGLLLLPFVVETRGRALAD